MANIGEAERCIEIAVQAMTAGDPDKAERMLQKSLRLHPTQRAQKLLLHLKNPPPPPAPPKDEPDASAAPQHNGGGSSARTSRPATAKGDEGVRFRGGGGAAPQQPQQQHQASRGGGGPTANNTTARDPDNSESSPGVGTSATEANYTAEQAREVDRIMKAKKNFYDVLLVEQKSFALAEVKKSYRKLALIVHPDKNKAPHSSEAFKVVGHAYATLSDNTKKNHYDQLLSSGRLDDDDDISSAAAAAAASHGGGIPRAQQQNFDYDDPDEIFRMFFGFEPSYVFQRRSGQTGGGGSRTFVYRSGGGTTTRHRAQHQHQQGEQPSIQNLSPLLLQLAPVLLLVFMSLLGQLFSADPDWSFAVTDKHTVQMQSSSLGVKFYVRPRVASEYSSDQLRALEATIENSYINGLRETCVREKHQRESMIWRAKMYADRQMFDRAKQMTLPACIELNKIYAGEG